MPPASTRPHLPARLPQDEEDVILDPAEIDSRSSVSSSQGPTDDDSHFLDTGEESTGLMMTEEGLTDLDPWNDELYTEDTGHRDAFRNLIVAMICVLVVATLAVLLPGIGSNDNRLESLRTPARIPVVYECPKLTTVEEPMEDASVILEDYAQDVSTNVTEFLKTFREADFDNWGHSYEAVKAGMYDFKSKYFPPYLQDGATMYESAFGIGLNLYMTLEILQEAKGMESLFVYGNDYLPASADMANLILGKAAPAHANKGVLCAGDSSNLDFVPSSAFDLVYTGYISPLLDPLHFQTGKNENYDFYTHLCRSPEDDWEGQKLNDIAQSRQEEWYGNWVAEMARIAKPGVPVIVEQVSARYCDAPFDWGGVGKDWWRTMATNNTYGWDIDPESIEMQDDTIFRQRYHVFMLKNGKRETTITAGVGGNK